MSVLQVYLSWANSVLCEVNRSVESVGAIQEGKILCEIIDVLAPDACLMDKMQASGTSSQRAYIQVALDHMKNNGVKIVFSTQDIIDGDIKSLLDVMWLLILNYGIHFVGQNSFQRTVGVGKKALLDWCQGELEVTFDSKNTLTHSLCSDGWFTKLLQTFAGSHIEEAQDKVTNLYRLLQEMEERYGIRRTIISPNDIIDGTVDEHTLMIYLSLLKRRVCSTARSARREMLSTDGKEAALAKVQERNRSVSEEAENRRIHSEMVTQSQIEQFSRATRAVSVDSGVAPPFLKMMSQARSQESGDSDWLTSESNSLVSGRDRSPGERGNSLVIEAEQVLMQTISEKVQEHIPQSDQDEDKDTDMLEQSERETDEKETESMSEFSSGAIDEGYGTVRNEPSQGKAEASREMKDEKDQTISKTHQEKSASSNGAKTKPNPEGKEAKPEKSEKIKIKRPKDYFLQWEETIDRLSHGPPDPPDVSDMSPRSPKQILRGISGIQSPRSGSDFDESDVFGGDYTPVWKRREYFEKRSVSQSSSNESRQSKGLSRSRSLPSPMSLADELVSSDRQENHSSESKNKTKSHQKPQSRDSVASRQTGRKHDDKERRSPTESRQKLEDSRRDDSATQGVNYRSQFMSQLDELQRSGRAQRVILPDLGPDAPVLMIPGQGEDVFQLFETLRQARIDVDVNMAKANGAPNGASNGKKSPTRRSPTQSPEETDLKTIRRTDKAGADISRNSSTSEEEKDTVGSLPRPTAHQHRVPKPVDIRVADLRSGRSKDPRRTQSLTEKKPVSPLVASSDSLRYHSLSPRRDPSSFQTLDQRDRSANRSDARDRPYSVENASSSRGSFQRSHGYSSAVYRSSPSMSPYREVGHHTSSLSPMRGVSPRSSPRLSATPERPPPLELPEDIVSPTSRTGGLGRVPRREAWERQRQRKETGPFRYRGADSLAQARFIEVLCKEIEELKQKVEIMEDSQVESSPERRSPNRGTTYTPTCTGENDTFYAAQTEIQETDNKMLLTRREDSGQSPRHRESFRSSSNTMHSSPRFRSMTSSTSPRRQHGKNTVAGKPYARQSPSPSRLSSEYRGRYGSRSRTSSQLSAASAPEVSQSERADSSGRSPGRSDQPISLGYKSPIRSVTQEIWGRNLSDTEVLQPGQREDYKRLISQKSLAEEDVIELKQSLASSVVENDILQAKMKNAHNEIQEKLNKTNEILDDCRRHLAKSQAENMELRTALEREKARADKSEALAGDLQQIVQQARADNDELEEELDNTLAVLDQSRPGYEALKEQNAKLRGRASVIQDENSSLKREMEDLRRSHFKSINTIRELRNLLDEVRGERSDLQQKLSRLERSKNETKVRSIISHYSQEKGAKDEVEREFSSSGFSSASERFQSSTQAPLSGTGNGEFTSTSSKSVTSNTSTPTPRPLSPGRNMNYIYEDTAPAVPSTYREIYPHRKPRYQSLSEKYGDSERHDSPVTFIDYPDLQHYPTKLEHYDADNDSLTDEQDDDTYGSVRPRDESPIYKPIPFRPYLTEGNSHVYVKLSDRTPQSAREAGARSPQTRGRSPVRLSQRFRECRSTSPSPMREFAKDRLNRSYDSAILNQGTFRSSSPSPKRVGEARRGILKSRTYTREYSPSPRYGSRSHSPPTRLPPENSSGNKKRMFARTQAGQIARDCQREFDEEGSLFDELRKKHTSKSWFELQFEDADFPSGDEFDDIQGQFSREEQLLLSEEQRRYANALIRKYTGIKP